MSDVIGRFGVHPSGAPHLGTLATALCSYLFTKSQGGTWHIRFEDSEPEKRVEGGKDAILAAFETHGLTWDSEPVEQGKRGELYDAELQRLIDAGHAFGCHCDEMALAATGWQATKDLPRVIDYTWLRNGESDGMYRHGDECYLPAAEPRRLRLRVPPETEVSFLDLAHGIVTDRVGERFGNFVLRRNNKSPEGRFTHYAGSIASVIDDAMLGATHVIRGFDNLQITGQHVFLQQLWGYPTPTYLHVPLVPGDGIYKASKSFGSRAVDDACACDNLWLALGYIGCQPPEEMHGAPPAELLAWAVQNFQVTDRLKAEFYPSISHS